MKRLFHTVCVLFLAAGCRTPQESTPVSQEQAMAIVANLCKQRCSTFQWVDEYGYMSVKGKTEEPRIPMDDLIREALEPHGWTIWIPTEDYFDDHLFRIGIKKKDRNKEPEATR